MNVLDKGIYQEPYWELLGISSFCVTEWDWEKKHNCLWTQKTKGRKTVIIFHISAVGQAEGSGGGGGCFYSGYNQQEALPVQA